ncbi:chromatin modification- protein VID21 [Myotisia sp. PD_48]|nr:chromatin modification- protein VID21 [Myotisia sp. PD_48]
MLRDELLRTKNDEIARCLLSRKRKLSELYFATVGFSRIAGHYLQSDFHPPTEAAFLDANDLTKGRFYNDNTLPAQPDLSKPKVSLNQELKKPLGSPPSVSQNATHSNNSQSIQSKKPSGGDPIQALADQNTYEQRFRDGVQQPMPPVVCDSKDTRPLGTAPRHISSPTPFPFPTSSSFKVEQSIQTSNVTPQPVETANGINGLGIIKPKSPELPSTPSLFPPEGIRNPAIAPANESQGHRSGAVSDHGVPVSIVVPSKTTDIASSPISSGPSSSHTSATERSPASSSTESLASPGNTGSLGKLMEDQLPASPSATHQPLPVLSTPDEQLKMEAAASMQNSAMANQLPNGYHVANQGLDAATIHDSSNLPSAENKGNVLEKGKPAADLEPLSKSTPPAASIPDDAQPQAAPSASSMATTKDQPSVASPESYPQVERMTTRVSSGAIRHKSVSEILGETPKAPRPRDTEPSHKRVASTPQSSPAYSQRLPLTDRTDKQRSRLSTVVFPKSSSKTDRKSMQLARRGDGEVQKSPNDEDDYLYTLFQAKAHYPPRTMSLNTLLSTAHKTLNTSNYFLEYHEQMDCRTLKRIYQLQHSNRWALRQLQRSPEPTRQGTHWDIVLDHLKWMRMDFREERKWKVAAARRCAEWCAEYVASNEEHRTTLCVPKRSQVLAKSIDRSKSTEMCTNGNIDDSIPNSHPTPELIPSIDDDSMSDEFNDDLQPDLGTGNEPAAIFSSSSNEFTFQMQKTLALDKILDELPFYGPVQIAPDSNIPSFKAQPDDVWKTELLPVSKYARGTIQFREEGPPRKRSRYHYDLYDDSSDSDAEMEPVPPEQNDVALFVSEFKNLRDRIHPNHTFRPPTEYLMPPVGFYESRQSSQWTYAEDDELRSLVREFSYNWSLISSCLSQRSKFSSGSDRRTPWECFERWIGLEGLPTEMAKTPYFRAYSARLEAAQRTILNAHQQAVQQQQQQQLQQQQQQTGSQPPPAPQPLVRRRTAQPLRVDRKRSSRHLTLLAGMRKLSQKREAMLQKQQHATQVATMRKANEASQPRPPLTTPQEFSRLKYEREVKYQEKQEQYRQQMIAHQRVAMAHRVAQHQQQQQSGATGQQPPFNAIPSRTPVGLPGAAAPGIVNGAPNGLPPGGGLNQSRPHPTLQGLPNNLPANGPLPPGGVPMKMMPQPGLQQPIGGRPPGLPIQTPENARIFREASRVQEQQRLVQSRQQQHQFHSQQPQPFVPQPLSSGINTPAAANQNNPALMAAFQAAASGVASPSFPASSLVSNASTASPRMNHLTSNPLVNPQSMPTVASIQNSFQRTHPNLPQDQINKMATERLQHYQQQQQRLSQAALNAAAGNLAAMPPAFQIQRDANVQQVPQQPVPNGVAPVQNPQAQGYSNLMRASPASQPSRMGIGSPAMNNIVMQQSRSVTPQNHRTGAAQGAQPQPQGQSPRPAQVQMASS